MTTLWIASKNPPFKRNGFDKPMFFNTYWKRKGTLSDEQVIEKAMTVFDKQFFNSSSIQGEISQTLTFQTFKIRLSQSGDIFRSSFFKIKFEKEEFNRYCWVIETRYLGQNTVEFTLETDLWITFMPQINFNNKRTVACKRRMAERYKKIGPNKDSLATWPLSFENNFLDPINSNQKYPMKKYKVFSDDSIAKDSWNKYFQFHSQDNEVVGMCMFALVKGNADDNPTSVQKQFANYLVAPYFIYPIVPDDINIAQMKTDNPAINPDAIDALSSFNGYWSFTKLGDNLLQGIYELPIQFTASDMADGTLYEWDKTLYKGFRFTKLGMQVFYEKLQKAYSINLNDYDKEFQFKSGKLLDKNITGNEPILIHNQVKSIQINNPYGNAPLIPFELFGNKDANAEVQSLEFQHYYAFNGATTKVVIKPYLFNYDGEGSFSNNSLIQDMYSNEFTYKFDLNSDVPSSVGAWDNFMQNHRSNYYTGAASGVINNILGAGMGVATADKPLGVGGIATLGVGAVASSLTSIAGAVAQQNDLKRQANSVNTMSSDYLQSLFMGNGDGLEGALGSVVAMEIIPSIKAEILIHYRLFGNPIQDRVNLSFELLQKREFWNYWELDDVQNTFIFDNIPPFVIDELDKMFSNGIRLWPVWWDAQDNYIDTVYDYDLENWETSLQLEF